jgi:hypothetical protein
VSSAAISSNGAIAPHHGAAAVAWWRVPPRAVGRHWLRFTTAAVGLCGLYYAGLIAVMAVRLGQTPNYGRLYDVLGAYALIWSSTPSTTDALAIMAEEPVFEIGYKMPEFGISEWSLMVGIPNVLQVLASAALIATFMVMSTVARRAACPLRRPAVAAAGTGAGMLALCSASLTWVVCCATPSWVVALSLLGVSLPLAQALGPFDLAFLAAGTVVAATAIALQARQIAHVEAWRQLTHGGTPEWR